MSWMDMSLWHNCFWQNISIHFFAYEEEEEEEEDEEGEDEEEEEGEE